MQELTDRSHLGAIGVYEPERLQRVIALLDAADPRFRELTGVEKRELHDEYGHALEQLIAAKASGGELTEPPVEAVPTVDLMAALEASVRAARAERGD
ncbi:hypothetical protein [Streptomyces sp. NPDC001820]|uniref:hypothetical protein n=1 Tax=Streptomyces sp. NPDC001820 TaxID=3364613 RepID=UPI0036978153